MVGKRRLRKEKEGGEREKTEEERKQEKENSHLRLRLPGLFIYALRRASNHHLAAVVNLDDTVDDRDVCLFLGFLNFSIFESEFFCFSCSGDDLDPPKKSKKRKILSPRPPMLKTTMSPELSGSPFCADDRNRMSPRWKPGSIDPERTTTTL